MAVVAVSRYDLITLLQGHLHADDDRLLADIKVAKAADGAHAIELAGLLLEPADQQHVAKCSELLFPGEFRRRIARFVLPCFLRGAFFGCGHGISG